MVLDFLSENRQQEKLLRYCLRLTRSMAAAKDLAQDVNVRIINSFNKEKITEINGAYLALTAHSIFVDNKRKASRKQATIEEVKYLFRGDDIEMPQVQDKTTTTLMNILNGSKYLSESEKTVLCLRLFTDKQFNEIASERGVILGSVISMHFRAINKLRSEFEENKMSCSDLYWALDGHDKLPEELESMHIEFTSRGRRPGAKNKAKPKEAGCTI